MASSLFRFNTRQLGEAVQRELQNQPLKARRAMNAVGGYLNGEIKDVTPQDDGFLASEISNKTVEYKKSFAAVVYVPSNGQSADYAIPMHEGQYQLGSKSLDKQRKVGKQVGRKFITRAMDGNVDDIRGIIHKETKI
eukprot:TRINITY_DN42852_c0_g1_i1.p3 TRINITY_DN42852_c0_g1~~TRINITY_DN42852_c0_g1_i1.p3  ORF type:complete len:137 (-),score=33.82 TRINITY_DN42852_c0_g1_i1:437-847(-)